jgi:organic radical activating enzyme
MEKNKDNYYLSEHFVSIQGEGNCAGLNSLFLRFHFCNLTCTWCDTKYTWFADSGKFQPYSSEQLKALISSHNTQHIILTGGEPTLYRLDKLVVPGKKYHVESNGVFIPTEPLDITIADRMALMRDAMDESVIRHFNWVISPKLSNSRQQINEHSLSFWAKKDYCIFKFIIRNESDLDEIEIVLKRFNIARNKVYVGLEGQSLESQLKPALVDEIIKRGLNFSPRLHVMLWGASRGK